MDLAHLRSWLRLPLAASSSIRSSLRLAHSLFLQTHRQAQSWFWMFGALAQAETVAITEEAAPQLSQSQEAQVAHTGCSITCPLSLEPLAER
jgi:hypothetical protein